MIKAAIITLILLCTSSLYSLTIYAPKAPPTLPLLHLAEGNTNVEIVFYNDVNSEVIPVLIKEKKYLFIIPSNIAAKLYFRGEKIRYLGTTSLGILHILSSDGSVQNLRDLDGKTVYIGDPGSSPDVVSRYIFLKNNIKPNIVYSSSPEIVKFFIAGKAQNAVLPEPLASVAAIANTNGRRIADLTVEWRKLEKDSTGIPQVGIIGNEAYIRENREEITRFLDEYRNSVTWVKGNIHDAAILAKDRLGLEIPIKAVEASIPLMNLTFTSGKAGKNDLIRYFSRLQEMDKQTVGDKLPDDEFYSE